MTKRRGLLLQILSEERKHLSALELWEKARAQGAQLSLATVYNGLKHLVATEQVTELRFGEGKALYDARLDHHAHIHCTVCGNVEDIEFAPQIENIQREAASLSDYSLLSAEVTLKGICSPCQKGSHSSS